MRQYNKPYAGIFLTLLFVSLNNWAIAQPCNPICPATNPPNTFLHIASSDLWCVYDYAGECCLSSGGASSALPLPVELGTFKAIQKDKTIEVYWETFSEVNNDRFQLLSSQNGQDFEMIANIKSAGNRNTHQSYLFTDQTPRPGTNYYMLVQKDFDGTESYSKIISADFNNGKAIEMTSVVLAGDLAQLEIYAQDDTNVQMLLSDMTGKVLVHKSIALQSGSNHLEFILPASGMYIINLYNEAIRLTEKMLK